MNNDVEVKVGWSSGDSETFCVLGLKIGPRERDLDLGGCSTSIPRSSFASEDPSLNSDDDCGDSLVDRGECPRKRFGGVKSGEPCIIPESKPMLNNACIIN